MYYYVYIVSENVAFSSLRESGQVYIHSHARERKREREKWERKIDSRFFAPYIYIYMKKNSLSLRNILWECLVYISYISLCIYIYKLQVNMHYIFVYMSYTRVVFGNLAIIKLLVYYYFVILFYCIAIYVCVCIHEI